MKTFKEFIAESPQNVGALDFGLNDNPHNREEAARLLKKKVETIRETDGMIIFRAGSDEKGNVALLNKATGLIDYFVHYERRKRKDMGSFVTQLKLWRRRGSSQASGVTREIFFSYLLKKYGAIMSDSQQTERGKEFWIDRLGQAFGLGHRIGLADMNFRQIKWFDGDSGQLQDWLKRAEKNEWGDEDRFHAKRFVISLK